jgi:hypothetical protein
MKDRSTEDLVQQLVQNLAPVKPIARLRVAASAVVALWLFSVVSMGWVTDWWPRLSDAAFWSSPVTVAVLIGLAVAAAGAIVAAMASAIPGRESLARVGSMSAGVAAVWVVACGLWAVAGGERLPIAGELAGSVDCVFHALALALPAALAVAYYLSCGALQHRLIGSGIAAAGAAGLGAVAVHASCDLAGGLHLLLGHCLTPILSGLLFALPLAALVGRWSPVSIES